MIKVKKGLAKTKEFSFPLMSQAVMFFLQNMGRCSWLFYKEIWEHWGFCFLPKIPTPAKENSRAWAWALQQNIMGLNFKTYPTTFSASVQLRLEIKETKENIQTSILWSQEFIMTVKVDFLRATHIKHQSLNLSTREYREHRDISSTVLLSDQRVETTEPSSQWRSLRHQIFEVVPWSRSEVLVWVVSEGFHI